MKNSTINAPDTEIHSAVEGTEPKVSVVIPTYNRPDMVCRAIESVRAQTYLDWELIVVDDCSPDDGLTEVAVDAIGDPRIRYSRNEVNRKLPGSRNAGARLARGNYIAFLDDDDEWLPEKLERQVAVFENSDNARLGAVISWIYHIDEIGQYFALGQERFDGDIYEKLLGTTDLTTTGSCLMISRSVLDSDIYHDDTFAAYEDYDYLIRISKYFDVATVDLPLVLKHEDFEGFRVWSSETKLAGEHRILDKYSNELSTRRSALAKKLSTLAVTYARANKREETMHYALATVRTRPINPSYWLLVGAALLGVRPFATLHPIVGSRDRLARIKRRFKRMTGSDVHRG